MSSDFGAMNGDGVGYSSWDRFGKGMRDIGGMVEGFVTGRPYAWDDVL